MEMANPYQSMVSFQQGLLEGWLSLDLVRPYQDVFSYFDEPSKGEFRFSYVRLATDRKTVIAFVACLMNGEVDGCPCVSVIYAVPERLRNQGLARQLLKDVILDQAVQAGRAGHAAIHIEVVADVTNLASQRVAEAVLSVAREGIADGVSGRPAYRYTSRVATVS